MMMGVFGLIVDCSMRWGWSSLLLLSIWLSLVWLIVKAIHFTYELHTWVIRVAIKTRYHSHWTDFHRSNLSLKKFLLLINCTLGSLAWLSKPAIVFTDLTFIDLICYWDNSFLLMNCTLGLLAWLLKLAIVLIDLTFIALICNQNNSLYSWIAYSVLPFIWALM